MQIREIIARRWRVMRNRRWFIPGIVGLMIVVPWMLLGMRSGTVMTQIRSYSMNQSTGHEESSVMASENAGNRNSLAASTSFKTVAPPKLALTQQKRFAAVKTGIAAANTDTAAAKTETAPANRGTAVAKVGIVPAKTGAGSVKMGIASANTEIAAANTGIAAHETDTAADGALKVGTPVSSDGYEYPKWFASAWPFTAVAGLQDQFVGDGPLFPPCQDKDQRERVYPFEEPRKYIARSKNPCWYEQPKYQKGLRCAPYFYLAGVAKDGTTDLYRRVRLHPDVMMGTMNEYHWWDRDRYSHLSKESSGSVKISGGVTMEEYLEKVTGKEIKEVAADLREGGTSVKIFGDGSSSYLWDAFNWPVLDGNQDCVEPRMVTSQHIRHFYPDAKIILTFSHPTPRLYSRFLSRFPRNPDLKKATPEDFHKYVVRSIRLYRACFKLWSIRHCAYNHTVYQEAFVNLAGGFYPVFMGDWLRIWSREQMLILRYEDYRKNVRAVLERVFNFLDLAPLNETQMANVTARDPVNVENLYETIVKIVPQTEAILDEFYEPFNRKLAEQINDSRFLWLERKAI